MTTEAERPADAATTVADSEKPEAVAVKKSRAQRRFERCKPLDPTAPYSGGSNAGYGIGNGVERSGNEETATAERLSRATIEHPKVSTVAERVAYIAELMASMTWTHDTSRRLQQELSDTWGVEREQIRKYSAEASRLALDSLKELRPELARIALEALTRTAQTPPEMPGDRGAAVTASKVLLEHVGIDKPEENQPRQSTVTVVQVGAAATSPALQAMFGPAKVLPEPVSGVVHEAVPVPG
jgi:hypothetical protein